MDVFSFAPDPVNREPRYRQLSDAVAGAIARGDLPPGVRLPAERDLAERLGLSRTTVVNAYRELAARGLVRGQVGRGTFVCAAPDADEAPFAWRGKLARAAERAVDPALMAMVREPGPDTISFAPGLTALDCFPLVEFRAATEAVLSAEGIAAYGFGPTEGEPALRAALASSHRVRSEHVLVLTGSQQGLDLISRCLIDPGDVVVMDRPGYLGAIQTFRAVGARLVGWDITRADPEELEDLLLRFRPKVIYTNPTFQNPTGRVLPLGERLALLDLAARYRIPVIEDEPYRDLYFGPPPPPSLFELDEAGTTIRLGTCSKVLAPGLRLGWLLAPRAIVDQLAILKARSDVFSPVLPQLVVARMLERGQMSQHLARLRVEHRRRHDAMLSALSQCIPAQSLAAAPVAGGFYLWAKLGPEHVASAVVQGAEAAGVTLVDGQHFHVDGSGARHVRICFTGTTPERIVEGVRRLAAFFSSPVSPASRGSEGRRPLV